MRRPTLVDNDEEAEERARAHDAEDNARKHAQRILGEVVPAENERWDEVECGVHWKHEALM